MVDIKTLQHRWKKFGYVYSVKDRVEKRLKHFREHCCNCLKDKDVLELACNSGVFGLLISEYSKSYVGVEPNITYFKQANLTRKYTDSPMRFINQTVRGLTLDFTFNALVINFSLYRFSDKEIKKIEDRILPKCGVVCIQNRTVERERQINKHGFRDAKTIVRWLRGNGFDCYMIWGDKGKDFSCIVGKK